ncbi:hypothetical protein VNI00_009751 [Paramarasmius palmivorus]|uniref:Uncharacterized protein n=1 Tax=Paramarasmius palmivorus TaxID=297713 RepID=A0AAW0CMS2_9AGAR
MHTWQLHITEHRRDNLELDSSNLSSTSVESLTSTIVVPSPVSRIYEGPASQPWCSGGMHHHSRLSEGLHACTAKDLPMKKRRSFPFLNNHQKTERDLSITPLLVNEFRPRNKSMNSGPSWFARFGNRKGDGQSAKKRVMTRVRGSPH